MPNRRGIVRSIYALIDPRDNTICYIGCTVDEDKRLSEQLRDKGNAPKCLWLAELKRQGLNPRLEILEVVDGFYRAFSQEDKWISRMLAMGAPLTNSLTKQGVFTKQQVTPLTYSLKGTKLRVVRKRLRVGREEFAYQAGIRI